MNEGILHFINYLKFTSKISSSNALSVCVSVYQCVCLSVSLSLSLSLPPSPPPFPKNTLINHVKLEQTVFIS